VVFEVNSGQVTRRCFEPGMFGVPVARPEDLRGGDIETNRDIAMSVLLGKRGPQRDIVLVNASAALVLAGRTPDLRQGVALAAASIDSGSARAKLEQLVQFTTDPI